MSTQYILHGGNIRTSKDEGKAYFEAIVRGLGEIPRILLCFYAQPREVWEEKFSEWTARISSKLPTIKPEFEMALPENFEKQSVRSDVLFLYGGDNQLLLEQTKKTKNFTGLLLNYRVVTGSSAGAIILSNYSWGCDRRQIFKGLAVVPVNTIVHFGGLYGGDDARGPIDWQKAEQELREVVGKNAQVICLREGQFETF